MTTKQSIFSRSLYLSIAFGVAIAFFDVGLSIAPHPPRLESLPIALLAVATTMVTATLCYAALWFVLVVVTRGHAARHTIGFVGMAAALVAIELMFSIPLEPRGFLALVAIGLMAGLTGLGGGYIAYKIDVSKKPERLAAPFTAIPILAGLTFLFVWMQVYKVGSPTSLSSLLSLLAYGVLTLATAAVAWRAGAAAVRRATYGLAVVLLVLGGIGWTKTQPNNATHAAYSDGHAIRRVVLITIDTLRRDALSCYGGETETPNLDRLAADGVVFDNALSAAPWTLPAMASIMTGMPPAGHTAVVQTSTLPTSVVTIAERMRDAGYHTGAVVDNEYFARDRSMDQGFASYQAYPKQRSLDSVWRAVLSRVKRLYFLNKVTTTDITDLAIRWVEDNREREFLFWTHYFDPHGPWQPPAAYQPTIKPPPGMSYTFRGVADVRAGLKAGQPEQRDWIKHLYDAEVRYVDAEVGRLLDALRSLGLYDDALIIVTSDHGEEFFEHGNFGHGQSLYDELLGVPLIVKLPGNRTTGRAGAYVPTQAIKATLLDVCGLEYDNPDENVVSFAPLLDNPEANFEEKPIFSGAACFYEDREAVTFQRTKYIRALHSLEDEMYNLTEDPGELNNIVGGGAPLVGTAHGLLDEHERMCADMRERFQVFQKNMTLDPETIRRLKALGYL